MRQKLEQKKNLLWEITTIGSKQVSLEHRLYSCWLNRLASQSGLVICLFDQAGPVILERRYVNGSRRHRTKCAYRSIENRNHRF